MAIGLNDVKKVSLDQKKSARERGTRERTLRPWENEQNLELQTRTIAAREAVDRARDTVERNNQMVEDIKLKLANKGYAPAIRELSEDPDQAADEFDRKLYASVEENLNRSGHGKQKISSNAGIRGFLKGFFN